MICICSCMYKQNGQNTDHSCANTYTHEYMNTYIHTYIHTYI